MKRQLIEISPRNQNDVDSLLGGAQPRLLVTEHYFPSAPKHRLIASGAEYSECPEDGEQAAFAARRLMRGA